MSASERLRELDGAMTDPALHVSPFAVIGGHGEWAKLALPYFVLRNALPLIADVVEAAEATIEGLTGKPWAMVPGQADSLSAALTALREALGEK